MILAGISGASYYEGSFSNIQRSPAGDYVAVSSRGNFFLTWSPGQTYWQPHNRPTWSLVTLAQQAPCIGPTKRQIAISQGAMPITSLSASCEESGQCRLSAWRWTAYAASSTDAPVRFRVARAGEVLGPARGGVGARHGEDAQQHAVAGRMDRATEAGASNFVALLYSKAFMQSAAGAEHGVDAQQHAVAETLTEVLVEEAYFLSQRFNISKSARRARRVQNMGWTPSNTLWLATRGGDVYLSSEAGVSDKFDQAKLGSRGFGILDVG